MHHVILGAGGIGGGIGARLVLAGSDVTLIARGAHLERMQREGLRLRTPEQDVTLEVTAVGDPSEVAWRGDEVVLLTVKSQDTAAALDQLLATAGPGVPVVCAQNGVENERIAARRFERVYGMLLNFPATFLTPGEVLLHGIPRSGVLDAGCYPRGLDATVEELCAHLETANFAAAADAAVMRKKYAKLLMNLGNAVQALAETRDAGGIHRALRAEALACYEAAGIDYMPLEELVAAARPHLHGRRDRGCTARRRLDVAGAGARHRLRRGRSPQRRDRVARRAAWRTHALQPRGAATPCRGGGGAALRRAAPASKRSRSAHGRSTA